jgi:hypothetical protein
VLVGEGVILATAALPAGAYAITGSFRLEKGDSSDSPVGDVQCMLQASGTIHAFGFQERLGGSEGREVVPLTAATEQAAGWTLTFDCAALTTVDVSRVEITAVQVGGMQNA